ncbi:hypothetical protein [Helicobacter labacensis]|uniref:hypothetical protein n=1 Tax=Helicobacter labacensis TaxID=2316079 RepID=UPI0019696A2B|nr:hypothetical protein [Helicobacter labacensis]
MKKHSWVIISIFLFFFVPSFGLGAPHTPTNPQEQAFFKAAKDLYDSLVNAQESALQAAIKAECDPSQTDQSLMASKAVARHYKTWISLATQMIDHVPFMARLKSLSLYNQIRSFEALHAFGLVRAKINNWVNCANVFWHDEVPPPKPLEEQKLLKVLQQNLEFFYSLLLNASKQGLPLESFLHTLTWGTAYKSPTLFGTYTYQYTLLSQLRFSSKEDSAKLKELKEILAKDSSPTICALKP